MKNQKIPGSPPGLGTFKKSTFCLYSLSLSLLEPCIQLEAVALRFQWRKKKLDAKVTDLVLEGL